MRWLVPTAHKLGPSDPLFILHHPGDRVMQLSLDTKAVKQVDGIGPRIQYRTNTIAGSSGSPCLTADLQLVALHQGTDPKRSTRQYNQGIPLSAIARNLRARWNDDPAKRASLPWAGFTEKGCRTGRVALLMWTMFLIAVAEIATVFSIGRVEARKTPVNPPGIANVGPAELLNDLQSNLLAKAEVETLRAKVRNLEEAREKLLNDSLGKDSLLHEMAEKTKTSQQRQEADAARLRKEMFDRKLVESRLRTTLEQLANEKADSEVQSMIVQLARDRLSKDMMQSARAMWKEANPYGRLLRS